MSFHKNLTGTSIHTPVTWTYANAALRASGTGNETSSDLYKFALQSDTNSLWLLTSIGPPLVWSEVGALDAVASVSGQIVALSGYVNQQDTKLDQHITSVSGHHQGENIALSGFVIAQDTKLDQHITSVSGHLEGEITALSGYIGELNERTIVSLSGYTDQQDTKLDQHITSVSGHLEGEITALSGTVDNKVTGPASSTDNTLVRFDGTTGKLVQGSAFSIDDTGLLAGTGNIDISGSGIFDQGLFVTGREGVQLRPWGTLFEQVTELRFYERAANGGNYAGFRGNDSIPSGTDLIWNLPVKPGSQDQVLFVDGFNNLNWRHVGDVSGVLSSTPREVAVFFDTTGRRIVAAPVTIDIFGAMSGVDELQVDDLHLNLNILSSINGDIILSPSGNINASNNLISNLLDPSGAQDAATKGYVDAFGSASGVNGPASSVDNALALFDGTTGKLIKEQSNLVADPTSQLRVPLGAGFEGSIVRQATSLTAHASGHAGSLNRYQNANGYAYPLNMSAQNFSNLTGATVRNDGIFIFARDRSSPGWDHLIYGTDPVRRVSGRTFECIIDCSQFADPSPAPVDEGVFVGVGADSYTTNSFDGMYHSVFVAQTSTTTQRIDIYESGTFLGNAVSSLPIRSTIQVRIVLKTAGADYFYKLDNGPWTFMFATTSSTATHVRPSVTCSDGEYIVSEMTVFDNGIWTQSPIIEVLPSGTVAGGTGETRYKELTANGNNFVGFKAPDTIAADQIWTLPSADATTPGQVLTSNGSGLLSFTGAGTGDVVGPASGTDNALVRFDGATGKLVQDSPITLNDGGELAGATRITVDNLAFDGNTISATNTNGNISVSPPNLGRFQVLNSADFAGEDKSWTFDAGAGNLRTGFVKKTGEETMLCGGSAVSLLFGHSSAANLSDAVTGQTLTTEMIIRPGGQVRLGPTDTAIDASILLELVSTTRGFMLPTMTTAQRDAISSPVAGLLLNDSSINQLMRYNGSGWAPISSGTGDVVGPSSATDNAIARFDATTGKLIQNSLWTIADTGAADAQVNTSRVFNFKNNVAGEAAYMAFNNSDDSRQLLMGVDGTGFKSTTARGLIGTWTAIPLAFAYNTVVRLNLNDSNFELLPWNTGVGNTQEIRFRELFANGSNYVGFKASDAIAANVIWRLPAADGNSNQPLVTDANGNLSWATARTWPRQSTAVSANFPSDTTFYGVTDTSVARTITIGTLDITEAGKIFIIKDESGAATTNNITIATGGNELIDGQTTATISVNYGVIRLYSDGTNLFSW